MPLVKIKQYNLIIHSIFQLVKLNYTYLENKEFQLLNVYSAIRLLNGFQSSSLSLPDFVCRYVTTFYARTIPQGKQRRPQYTTKTHVMKLITITHFVQKKT